MVKKKLRVLVLMHRDLVPPAGARRDDRTRIPPWRTERDILRALHQLGHEVRSVGVHDDVDVLRGALAEFDPDITFNVLEELHDVALYAPAVISYLEISRRAFTGCNPRGLIHAHDKLLTKQTLAWQGIRTPRGWLQTVGAAVRRPRELAFPLMVKSAVEDASLGISRASVVRSDQQLLARVHFLHERFGTDVLVEEFVEGRELYVGVLGNLRPQTLPILEMSFGRWPARAPRIATRAVKWSASQQRRWRIRTALAAGLALRTRREIQTLALRTFRALGLTGYARIDLRLDPGGRAWVLEANANPDLARAEDFAASARALGISYEHLIQRILELGLRWRAPWRG
jgi:D-alanine-D-alanine ligase